MGRAARGGRHEEAERVRAGVLDALDRLGRAPELYAVEREGALEPVPRQPGPGVDRGRAAGARGRLGRPAGLAIRLERHRVAELADEDAVLVVHQPREQEPLAVCSSSAGGVVAARPPRGAGRGSRRGRAEALGRGQEWIPEPAIVAEQDPPAAGAEDQLRDLEMDVAARRRQRRADRPALAGRASGRAPGCRGRRPWRRSACRSARAARPTRPRGRASARGRTSGGRPRAARRGAPRRAGGPTWRRRCAVRVTSSARAMPV